jgi:hypothetical protein
VNATHSVIVHLEDVRPEPMTCQRKEFCAHIEIDFLGFILDEAESEFSIAVRPVHPLSTNIVSCDEI